MKIKKNIFKNFQYKIVDENLLIKNLLSKQKS